MPDPQNYEVNYTIKVDATEGAKEVQKFADSIKSLVTSKTYLPDSIKTISEGIAKIDKIFRPHGKKRDYTYKFGINTDGTENRLKRIKTLLADIRYLAKAVDLRINASQPTEQKNLKPNAKALLDKKLSDSRKAEMEKNAASSVKTMMETQRRITKAIGKINAALMTLEKGREVNLKTDLAQQRLQELLGTLRQLKGACKMTLGVQMGSPGKVAWTPEQNAAYTPKQPFVLSQKASEKLQEKLITNRVLTKPKEEQKRADEAILPATKRALIDAKAKEWDRRREVKENQARERRAKAEADRATREKSRLEQQAASHAVTAVERQRRAIVTGQTSKQRAAINRMQYVRTPSIRNLPMMYMMNGYAMYGLLKSELIQAVEYNNIMTSAQSILRVADNDLTTFENRFNKMALYVRKIGVETKFTAVEVAGAVKYLSMAGMSIETINDSIRPIVNLALIGDNDVSQIADLTTNIQTGYDIKNTSMGSVADILASTVSRSNVNVLEMAESYKMAAGYMRMAGVEFTESAAAIGLLGNMGIKGTMAGTSLRAMATRFAKPTKESQKTLDLLGVKFTEYRDVYGKQIEKLRPLADIFEDLHKKGATVGDMQAIFGKIGGNAAMMFVQNYGQLRTMTSQNRASHGISSELAKVKQDNTKGLWAQVTSQFTESFMQGYEVLEPVIRSVLRDLLSKFNASEFTRGLTSIGQSILSILSLLGNVATWFTRNFTWLEPLLFSGFVATKLFKLAGALTNVGVALGFIGKQSAAGSVMQMVGGLSGGGRGMSFAQKRAIVSAMSATGVSGKGAMRQALLSSGMGNKISRGALGLFSTQVATGNGLVGAGASIGALGSSAVAATAAIAGLVGALGWVAYKTWKVKEAKDAVLEEIEENRKYRYPSIDALNKSLSETYRQAMNARQAVDELTAGKTIEEASGKKIGAFTGNWWSALLSSFGAASSSMNGGPYQPDIYSHSDAIQDDTRQAILTLAKKDSQARINSAYAKLGKARTDIEIGAFIQNIQSNFGQDKKNLDTTLWRKGTNGKITYGKGVGEMKEADAYKLYDYAEYMNQKVVPEILMIAQEYRRIMSSSQNAQALLRDRGFDFDLLTKYGFYQNKSGNWVQKAVGKNATNKEREDTLSGYQKIHNAVVNFTSSLRQIWGGSAEIAENIMKKAGFTSSLYSNEPDYADPQPFNANGLSFHGADDDHAGGNYSGTGKLSSAAPKQVIINITNLLSLGAINLLKSKEGQQEEVQNLKEQLAQALIDVVHDFDLSWNG